uniref:Homologous-pairing protein 2 winged helix domain-containing protein n=1 Tax=Parascaris univalens TaxID=6257 RepID=A0A915A1A5_PARUN
RMTALDWVLNHELCNHVRENGLKENSLFNPMRRGKDLSAFAIAMEKQIETVPGGLLLVGVRTICAAPRKDFRMSKAALEDKERLAHHPALHRFCISCQLVTGGGRM